MHAAFFNKLNYWLVVAVLVFATLIPLLMPSATSAAQFTQRRITMGSSVPAATNVTYTVEFTPTHAATDVLGFVIEFCANSPLVGSACTGPDDGNSLEGFDVSGAAATGWTVDAATTVNRLVLTRASDPPDTEMSNAAAETITVTGVVNPNPDPGVLKSFFSRLVSYETAGGATSYTSTAPGTHLDNGGIALTTADQLTVFARVQEVLEFCIAAVTTAVVDDASAPEDCLDAEMQNNGTEVDMGVVDSTGPRFTPTPALSGGNNLQAGFIIRTNASFGAAITYAAVLETSSGRLKVPGQACDAVDPGTSNTDQCFNDTTNNPLTATGEGFGITGQTVLRPTNNTTTTNLAFSGDYVDPDTYTWVNDGTATTIATSGGNVLDYEFGLLRFGARAAATTPTGSYAVNSVFVATSTF